MAPDGSDPRIDPDPLADDLDGPEWWDALGIPVPPAMTEEAEAAADARADADIAAGRVVPHEKVVEWVNSWKTAGYKPFPREWFE